MLGLAIVGERPVRTSLEDLQAGRVNRYDDVDPLIPQLESVGNQCRYALR